MFVKYVRAYWQKSNLVAKMGYKPDLEEIWSRNIILSVFLLAYRLS